MVPQNFTANTWLACSTQHRLYSGVAGSCQARRSRATAADGATNPCISRHFGRLGLAGRVPTPGAASGVAAQVGHP
jgi:hypothetical protein